MVPAIETARLRLRGFTAADLPQFEAMLGDPQVMRHIGGRALSREESWRRIACNHGLWALVGYGYWVVERKDDGVILGQIGFADFKRAMTPSIEGLPEMGWVLGAHAHGQGFATEAVRAGLDWADANLSGQDVVAIIAPDNEPSIRVAEKAGFGDPCPAEYHGEPIILFRRPSRQV